MEPEFFSSVVDLYAASGQAKQSVIVTKLAQCGNPDKFVQFLNTHILGKSFKANVIFNFVIDYGLEAHSKFTQETLKRFVDFFIRLLAKRPNPSSFTKFSKFLTTVFASVESYDNDKIFQILKDLPPSIAILPLTYFAVQNRQYLQQVFDYATSSPDQIIDNPASVLWNHSIVILFSNAGKDVHYDPSLVYSCAELSVTYPSIPIAQRFSLLAAAISFLDATLSNQLIEAHYKELVSSISQENTPEELATALDASLAVFKHIKNDSHIDDYVVFDGVFNQILVYYRPCDLLDHSLLNFCEALDPVILKALLNPFIAANINSQAAMFIISHIPDDDFISYLLGENLPSITLFQYKAILYYLTHHPVPSRYLPHVFKIVNVNDMPILDCILLKRPHMYCCAAAKYLTFSEDIAKIQYIAQRLSTLQTLPFIRTRALPDAFVNIAIHTLQGETANKAFAVLMEYVFACSSRNLDEEEIEDNIVQLSPNYPQHNPEVSSPLVRNHEEEEILEEEDIPNEEEQANEENIVPNVEPKSEETKTPQLHEEEESKGEVVDQLNEEEEEVKDKVIQQFKEEEEEMNEEINANPQNEEKPQEISSADTNNQQKDNNKVTTKEAPTNDKKTIEPHSNSTEKPKPKSILSKDFSSSALFLIENDSEIPDADFFDVSSVHFNAPSPAALVRDICMRSSDWCTELTNKLLDEIRTGKLSNCLMIAAISGDPKLLQQCIDKLDSYPSLLVHFFTVAGSVSPHIALKQMKCYVTPVIPEVSLRNFFVQAPGINEVRVETILHSLISMAPFVTITSELIELLVFSFTNMGSAERQRIIFSYEAVRAICSSSKHMYPLDGLIFLMTKHQSKCDPKTFIEAIVATLRANDSIGPKLSQSLSEIWINILVSGVEIDLRCGFEAAFLSQRFRIVTLVPFLTQLEQAFIKHEDCLPLYMSLARIMRMKAIDPSFLQRYLTLCIANSLSDNLKIRKFCVSTLKNTQKLQETIPDISFGEYTTDSVEATRPFFTELASKFRHNIRILLLDALLKHFIECRPQSRTAILLFVDCLVTATPDIFLKCQKQFVVQLLVISNKFEPKSSLAALHSQILYALQCSSPDLFFSQFLEGPDTHYCEHFLSRFFGNTTFSKSFSHCVFEKVEEYISGGDPAKLPRLIKYLSKHIISGVFLYSPSEELATVLFSILIILSQLFMYKKQKKVIDQNIEEMQNIMSKFAENTTVTLCNSLDLSSDDRFSASISSFVQNFARLPNQSVNIFVKKVYKLSNTPHSTTGGIVFAHILSAYSNAYSTSSKQMLADYLAMFFAFLKEGKTSDPRIVISLMSAISLFTPQSFSILDYLQISKLLNITFDSATTCPMKSLHVLNLITQVSDPRIMDTQNGSIIACLRIAVNAGCDEDVAFEVLLRTVKARHEAQWFLKDSPISFSSLTTRLAKGRNQSIETVLQILLGITGDFKPKLVFSTMMSIFAAYEQSNAHYVTIADNIFKTADPTKATAYQITLMSAVVLPLTSLADATASTTLEKFHKFLITAMNKNNDNQSLASAIEALSDLTENKMLRVVIPK